MRGAGSQLRVVLPTVVLDYALSYSGYFVVMPVLPLVLASTLRSSGTYWIGLCLGALSLAMRGGSLFVSGWMHRTCVRTLVASSMVMVATGFAITAVTGVPLLVLLALTLAGLGFSINGLTMRGYVALRVPDRAAQNSAFSIIQIVVNVAAAIGPVIANLMLDSTWFRIALLGSAVLFLLAALLVPLTIPAVLKLGEGAARPPLKLRLASDLVTDPKLRPIALIVLVGGFLYGQFFSSFAVMINGMTKEPLLRAGFYTLNGATIVVLQLAVTKLVNWAQSAGVSSVQVLACGVGLFGGSFAILATSQEGIVVPYLAIVLFSFGETVYTPMVNTAFIEASEGRPIVEAFNLRQLASAVGEGLGATAGGWLYGEAVTRRAEPYYWGGLGLLAAAAIILLSCRRGKGMSHG